MGRLGGRAFRVLLAGATAGLLVGCGGGNHKGSTVETSARTTGASMTEPQPSQHELAKEYLRLTAPANAVTNTFEKKAKSYGSNTTGKQVASDLAPVIAAIEKADSALLRVNWPPGIAADVKGQVAINGVLVGDLRAVRSRGLSHSWLSQVSRDGDKSRAAANIVRADLGLPPVKP